MYLSQMRFFSCRTVVLRLLQANGSTIEPNVDRAHDQGPGSFTHAHHLPMLYSSSTHDLLMIYSSRDVAPGGAARVRFGRARLQKMSGKVRRVYVVECQAQVLCVPSTSPMPRWRKCTFRAAASIQPTLQYCDSIPRTVRRARALSLRSLARSLARSLLLSRGG